LFGIKNGTLSLINLATGEKVLESVEVINPSIETNMSVDWKPSFTMTMGSCRFSPEDLEKLLGNNQRGYNIEANGTRVVMVQAKKHKSKRINKKWSKRYGYKEIQVPIHMNLDNCTISPNEHDRNCFSVEGKINNII